MRKIYILLALLLSQFNSANAQNFEIQLPFVDRWTETIDSYGVSMGILAGYMDGEYASVWTVPYEGIMSGSESTLIAAINQQLSPVLGQTVRCVGVSGIDPSNSSASKGLIYLQLDPLGPNDFDRFIVLFSSENITATVQCPSVFISDEYIMYGLDISPSGQNVNFNITGSYLRSSSTYSLRKVTVGQHCSTWQTVATFNSTIPYNPAAVPSGTIAVPAISLEAGDYVIVNDTYDLITSNVSTYVPGAIPEYDWIDRPDESSTVRTYTLNKNGETHIMTASVPLGSNISVLRSILDSPDYTVSSDNYNLSFRLVDDQTGPDDITLTFEVSCEPNRDSIPITLSTGLSDRILPGIPNNFVQPGGGNYPATVELGEKDVTVHNTSYGTTYVLVATGFDFYFPVAYMEGNGGDIVFQDYMGLFYVAAYEDLEENAVPISGNFNLDSYYAFYSIPHLKYDSSIIEFDPDTLTHTITLRKEYEFNLSTLQEAIRGTREDLFERITYEYVEMTDSTCTFRITAPVNCSSSDHMIWSQILFGPNDTNLQVNVKPGGTLETYNITGTWNDPSHTSFDVGMSGSQAGVIYQLVLVREYPLTPVINNIVSSWLGNGDPFVFEDIDQKGIYKVVAYSIDGSQLDMSGTADMFDNSQILSSNTNHIRTKQYTDATGTAYNEEVVHYDGLGRPVQTISVGTGGNGNDIVQIVEYDNMGRNDTKTYLPYTRTHAGYQKSNLANIEQTEYYSNKFPGDPDRNYAYSRKEYDGTTIRTYGPGSSGADNPVQQESRLNTIDDLIKRYVIDVDGSSLYYAGNYAEGKLSVQKVSTPTLPVDQQSETYTFTNSSGQVIAEKTINGTDSRITYYIYDDMGRQRYVIPPVQDDLITTEFSKKRPDELRKYSYYNEYDDHGRIIVQYVPGVEPTYTLYDEKGRIAMMQDGRQSANGVNEWAFTKYDNYDRPIMTGTITGGTYESHKAALLGQSVFHETRGTALHGYTNNTYPQTAVADDILTVAYYDDYAWLANNAYAFSVSDALDSDVDMANVAGLQTGTKTKILGITDHQWQTSVTYYNSKYQSIQSVTDLYPEGREIVSNIHNFVGDVIETKVKQTVGSQTYGYSKLFGYDAYGRPTDIQQQMTGDNDAVTIVEYAYDNLGSVSTKSIHNNLETTSYSYDIVGRQIGVKSPSFSYDLWFDKAPGGMVGRHDGNLAHVTWGMNTTGNQKGYAFSYDGFGQMTSAKYLQPSGSSWGATESYAERGVASADAPIAYDKNGNILSLMRTDASGNPLHELQYVYGNQTNGNALSSVVINGTPSDDFVYDRNGNMTVDGSTGVHIEYNVLNLPERVFAGNEEIRYIYNAAGEKLATVAPDGSLTYYRSVFVYAAPSGTTDGELQYVIHPEGVIAREGSDWTYKYFKTDHVGSTRVLLAARGNGLVTEQTTDFYPFGLAHGTLNNLHLNRYLYGGKEYQDAMLNGSPLGLYDFHARYYNPVLGRWFNMDPANQFANPYLYCGNSPMMYSDPDGEWIFLAAAVVGAYLGGSAANDSFNPFKWDFGKGSTWAAMIGGAIQAVTTVVGIQAGFAQVGWEKMASFGRSKFMGKVFTGAIKMKNYSSVWSKMGMGVLKGGIVLNGGLKAVNTLATITSAISNSENAGRIIMGNYYYNPRRTIAGQIWEGISRGGWEGIQQSLGSAIGHIRNTFGGVDNVEFFDGATLINNNKNDIKWGLTLGSMINSQNLEASTDDAMFMHEYGHTQQSKLLGPLYPFTIAPMSGISALLSKDYTHSRRWYEMSANRHAKRYFGRFHNVDWKQVQKDNEFYGDHHGKTEFPTHR